MCLFPPLSLNIPVINCPILATIHDKHDQRSRWGISSRSRTCLNTTNFTSATTLPMMRV